MTAHQGTAAGEPHDRNLLVEVSSIVVEFATAGRKKFRALDEVDLRIERGSHLAVVGESGSGKSTLGRVLVGLQSFHGSYRSHAAGVWSEIAGRRRRSDQTRVGVPDGLSVQMVFQSSEASLDPRWTARSTVMEALARGHRLARRHRVEADEYLALVGIAPHRFDAKASELSGGQRQRVAIARALALQPDLLICDEATSALDVATRASILKLLNNLQHELGVTLCVITHDFTTAKALCDQTIVMSLGKVVERGATTDIIERSQAAYTQALLAAVPRLQTEGAPEYAGARLSRV